MQIEATAFGKQECVVVGTPPAWLTGRRSGEGRGGFTLRVTSPPPQPPFHRVHPGKWCIRSRQCNQLQRWLLLLGSCFHGDWVLNCAVGFLVSSSPELHMAAEGRVPCHHSGAIIAAVTRDCARAGSCSPTWSCVGSVQHVCVHWGEVGCEHCRSTCSCVTLLSVISGTPQGLISVQKVFLMCVWSEQEKCFKNYVNVDVCGGVRMEGIP